VAVLSRSACRLAHTMAACMALSSFTLGCCDVASVQAVQLSPFFSGRDITIADSFPYAVRVAWEGATPGQVESLDVFARHCKIPQTVDPVSKLLTFRRKEPFRLVAEYADANFPAGVPTEISRIDVSEVSCPPNEEKGLTVKVRVLLDLNGIIRFHDAFYTEEYEVEEVCRACLRGKLFVFFVCTPTTCDVPPL